MSKQVTIEDCVFRRCKRVLFMEMLRFVWNVLYVVFSFTLLKHGCVQHYFGRILENEAYVNVNPICSVVLKSCSHALYTKFPVMTICLVLTLLGGALLCSYVAGRCVALKLNNFQARLVTGYVQYTLKYQSSFIQAVFCSTTPQ